jgi:hypothetical protein
MAASMSALVQGGRNVLEQHVVVTSEFAQKPVVGFVLSGEELLKNSARSSDCRFALSTPCS